jgi:hypothetical protein
VIWSCGTRALACARLVFTFASFALDVLFDPCSAV